MPLCSDCPTGAAHFAHHAKNSFATAVEFFERGSTLHSADQDLDTPLPGVLLRIRRASRGQSHLPHSPRASQQMLEAVVEFRQRTAFGHNGIDTVLAVREARGRLTVEELPHLLAAHGLLEQVRVARRVLPPHHCKRDDVHPEKTNTSKSRMGWRNSSESPTPKQQRSSDVMEPCGNIPRKHVQQLRS